MKNESLPFVVRPVRDRRELDRAIVARQAAYARHIPIFAETLRLAEPTDHDEGVVVLFAESKLDGSTLGTMRIHTNECKPLPTEQSVRLPGNFAAKRLAEATRLGVANGKIGALVKVALFKALFEFCKANFIDSIVVAGRSPLDRMYQRLLFEDVFPGQGFVPLMHAGNIPHRIMSLAIASAHERWEAADHPLLHYFTQTQHPDLQFALDQIPMINRHETEILVNLPNHIDERIVERTVPLH